MKKNEDDNFDPVVVAHWRLGNPASSEGISMEEVVVVIHSVNSGDFMLREVVVVFRSVNSGELSDGCQGHMWRSLVNSGERRDGLG